MKKAICLVFLLFVLFFPTQSGASNYGECGYGEAEYGNGCNPSPTPTESTVTTTTANQSSSSTTTPGCNDQIPGLKTPGIYSAVPQGSDKIALYFTPADSPVSSYVLEYGTASGVYKFGVQDMGVNERDQMMFEVGSLFPDTTYFFRIRAQNGCATGNWSNEISSRTMEIIAINQLKILDSELINEVIETSETEEIDISNDTEESTPQFESALIDITVNVFDEQKNPIKGASVTLYSNPKTAITDENGRATFHRVESGEHELHIAFKNYEGKQSLFLTASEEQAEFNINVTVQMKTVQWSKQVVVLCIFLFCLSILLSMLLIMKWKKFSFLSHNLASR